MRSTARQPGRPARSRRWPLLTVAVALVALLHPLACVLHCALHDQIAPHGVLLAAICHTPADVAAPADAPAASAPVSAVQAIHACVVALPCFALWRAVTLIGVLVVQLARVSIAHPPRVPPPRRFSANLLEV